MGQCPAADGDNDRPTMLPTGGDCDRLRLTLLPVMEAPVSLTPSPDEGAQVNPVETEPGMAIVAVGPVPTRSDGPLPSPRMG